MQTRPINVTTAAYAASLIISTHATTLLGVSGYNSKVTAQFIQLHDSASLPADTSVPVAIFSIAPQSSFSLYFGALGRYFVNGIVACNSSTGPTKTIGSADCWLDAQVLS